MKVLIAPSTTAGLPAEGGQADRRRTALAAALLAAAVLLAFAPVCRDSYEFLNFDDPDFVTANRHVQAGLTLDNIRWAFTTFEAYYWFPLTWLSFEVDAQLYGLHPWGYHLTNVLLHTASTVVLFLALRRLTGELWRCAAVALLFGVHPLRVESVVWIAERKDVLSTFFWMLTLAAYARYAGRPSLGRYLLVVGAFALGLMAKPMLVTLPCVLLLLDYWPLRRWQAGTRAWLLLEKAPLLAMGAALSAVTLRASQALVMPLADFPLGMRVSNALVSCVRYLGKMVWPSDLAAYYPHPRASLPAWQVVLAALLLAGVTVIVLARLRRQPYLAVGWFWYLGTLVPVSGLVQLTTQALCYRFTYVPSVGLLLLACWGVADLARRYRLSGAVARVTAVVALGCIAACWIQQVYWSNSILVWTHTIDVTGSDNAMAQRHLGVAWLLKGDCVRAEQHLAAALRCDPDHANTNYNLGLAQLGQGRLDDARASFARALRARPDHSHALCGLASLLLEEGKVDEALQGYSAARASDPENPVAANGQGQCYQRLGRWREAIACYRRAVELQPSNAAYQRDLQAALQGEPTGP